MLIGKDAVLDFVASAKPCIIWLGNGSLSTANPTEIAVINTENADQAFEQLNQHIQHLGPASYFLKFTKVPGQTAGAGGAFPKQHAYGINFTIPRTGATANPTQPQSFSGYPMQGMPATIGNPYGERSYTKEELEDRVKAAVQNAKLELQLTYLQTDFARQIKEAKEEKSDTVGQLIGALPTILPMLQSRGPVAVAGVPYEMPLQHYAPQPANTFDATADAATDVANDAAADATPDQQALFNHNIAQLTALCNNDIDLLNLRLAKLIKLAPMLMGMLDQQAL